MMTSINNRVSFRRTLIAATALSLLVGTGMAHAQEAQRVRGTIESVDGDTLSVITREGPTASITLTDGWGVTAVAAAELSDIEPGDFVGIASLPTDDGTDGALEVLIFPEGMEGTGEGSYPWDLEPGSTMTNATVADKVESVDGSTVNLTYDGDQTKEIVIPADVPVVTFADATTDDLVEGATVFVPGQVDAAGVITANRVVVGRDGVVPPM